MAEKHSEVKARFRAEGISIAAWARANQFSPRLVYRLLSGELKGDWGEAHCIAVALGIKPKPKRLRFAQEHPVKERAA